MSWFYQQVLPRFTAPGDQPKNRTTFYLWAALLFILGALLWGKFINWGLGPYQYHDWADITIPRLTFLYNTVRLDIPPLHIHDGSTLGGVTDRYLTIPDALVSPQILLLRWLEIGPFLLVNLLLLYTVGFAGLIWLSQKKGLSPLAFTVLFLLFNFNGHQIAHISVGHYTWTAYFFYPWLVGLIFELVDGAADSTGWKWIFKVSLLLFVMLLQGGYHQFIWSLFLLALLIPVLPRQAWVLVRALVFAVLVSAARTLPPVLNLGKFDNKFIAGYPFMDSIWTGLVSVYLPNDYTNNLFLAGQIGTWEYTLYVGLVAVGLLGWFGLVSVYRSRERPGSYARLLFPIAGLALLSLNEVYQPLRTLLPLPLLTGERVASRIMILAFVLLLVLAVIEIQKWLDRTQASPVLSLVSLPVLGMLGNDLWQNYHLWRIPAAAQKFELVQDIPSRWAASNHPDPAYTAILLTGAGISLLALIALYFLARRFNQPGPQTVISSASQPPLILPLKRQPNHAHARVLKPARKYR